MIYMTTIGEVSRDTLAAILADAWQSEHLIEQHIAHWEKQAHETPHGYSDRYILPGQTQIRVARDHKAARSAKHSLNTAV